MTVPGNIIPPTTPGGSGIVAPTTGGSALFVFVFVFVLLLLFPAAVTPPPGGSAALFVLVPNLLLIFWRRFAHIPYDCSPQNKGDSLLPFDAISYWFSRLPGEEDDF